VQKHGFGLRGLLAAIVVIVLSTGAAAAAPPQAANGLATAAEKAGKTVPVAAQAQDEETEETEETELVEPAAEDSENCATDPTDLDETALAELTHGSIVCWAAHQETPAEFDNHGAWVSSWAKENHGHEEAADAAAAAGNNGNHGKPEGAGKP
jgi:hypothetical protein